MKDNNPHEFYRLRKIVLLQLIYKVLFFEQMKVVTLKFKII